MTKQKREKEQVVLVDEDGSVRESAGEILTLDRDAAHRQGVLHRAVSVFVFNTGGELLLQKRGQQKNHSAGLWTNTCCTHPRKGEKPIVAARRRLAEEMGLKCELNEVWSFLYCCKVSNGLIEHEYDYVFMGSGDRDPSPNADEVADWAWIDTDDLGRDLRANPGRFTPWFRLSYHEVLKGRDRHNRKQTTAACRCRTLICTQRGLLCHLSSRKGRTGSLGIFAGSTQNDESWRSIRELKSADTLNVAPLPVPHRIQNPVR